MMVEKEFLMLLNAKYFQQNFPKKKVQVFQTRSLTIQKHKILSHKQILQRLAIALAQVKPGNISENLLNVIRQIIYFCIDQKKLLKRYRKM